MPKFLVTGGAGFIGTNIVHRLVTDGHEVCVFDNLSTGSLDYLRAVQSKITFIKGDVRDLGALRKAAAGADYILHLAAWRAVNRSVDDPLGAHETNATGTLNVLLAARDAQAKRVVLSSSSSVYGNQAASIFTEKLQPHPESPYAATKLAGEYYGEVFSRLYGLDAVSLRYFNVYGPWQHPESEYSLVIPIFLDRLLKNKPPEIHGTGEQSRDFVYVGDVVEANVLAALSAKKLQGVALNIGSGQRISINNVNAALQRALGVSLEPIYAPARPGDVFSTCADISQAGEVLNFKPAFTFEQGIKASIEHYRAMFAA